MSIRLSSLAWELQMHSTNKLVLLAMCEWANDEGMCFPSMTSVARRACISKRQCQRIMRELISDDLIAVIGNQQGGRRSRRYQINLTALREGASGGAGDTLTAVTRASGPPVTSPCITGDTGVIRTFNNHQSDPPLHHEPSESIDWTYLPQFEVAERLVVSEMLNGLDEAEHQNIIDELAGALRAKTIKTQWPAWLRGLVQHARAGTFAPNHALVIYRNRLRVARETADAEARRIDAERRNDPSVRAKGLAAMQAAIATLARPAVTEDESMQKQGD